MCGLVGVFRFGEERPGEVAGALDLIAHRGPDNHGVWSHRVGGRLQTSATLSLGHVRLAILDLTDGGSQPMMSADGRAALIFNGEIYNFLELREQLSKLGHRFRTKTDTEVVLAAYREWGASCVERFIGMWALALWDGSVLFMSRDRLGKKPFYYHLDPTSGLFAFASEIKALRAIAGVPWEPDEGTVYRYLAFAEMERNGATFFKDIHELPAGSFSSFAPGDRRLVPTRFWSLPGTRIDASEEEAVRRVDELLFDSLRLRLRSDVPVGLCLSGGIDSTLLLGMLNEAGYSLPKVFSASYSEPGYNEREYLDLAIGQMECKPFQASTNAQQFAHDFPQLLYHLDQPSKLPGPFSLWRVVQVAQGHVGVLLDGQGADELFGGYTYFLPTTWNMYTWPQRIAAMPDLMRTAWSNRHLLQQYPPGLILLRASGRGSGRDASRILRRSWADDFSRVHKRWRDEPHPDLNTVLDRAVTQTSLPPLLRYGDRVSMAFGIENRCPFLDHRLVEYVSSLPAEMKIRRGTTKWLLRRLAAGRVPRAIVERRSKMGFPTPTGIWFRSALTDTARTWLREFECIPSFSRWVDSAEVAKVFEDHVSGRAENQALLWRVLALGAWLTGMRFPDFPDHKRV